MEPTKKDLKAAEKDVKSKGKPSAKDHAFEKKIKKHMGKKKYNPDSIAKMRADIQAKGKAASDTSDLEEYRQIADTIYSRIDEFGPMVAGAARALIKRKLASGAEKANQVKNNMLKGIKNKRLEFAEKHSLKKAAKGKDEPSTNDTSILQGPGSEKRDPKDPDNKKEQKNSKNTPSSYKRKAQANHDLHKRAQSVKSKIGRVLSIPKGNASVTNSVGP